eukprot:TRINITY_DN10258_c0_g1_i1.p1 TRINITY_DN10258_c0_g1~~TRINITY_DN10258_c0_g1_i1.p1  ORF type:complete len:211 (+),score=54.07 TRINITY_DN10258_c0_g1_i1:68-700(+)
MISSSLLSVLVIFSLLQAAAGGDGSASVDVKPQSGVTLRLNAWESVCIYNDATLENELGYFHFLVTSGGNQDIDAKVLDPDDEIIWQADRSSEERIMFKTKKLGTYSFCFSNMMSTLTHKTVTFDAEIGDAINKDMDPLEVSIIKVHEALEEVKQEQMYLRTRERVHRDMAEETNSRVLVFSVLEVAMLLVMGLGQIVYLRQQFEVKRSV